MVRYKILYILLTIAVAFGLVYIYFNDPSVKPFIPCYFHEITGLECTGCGITRAIYSLMHLDIVAAIKFNTLFVFSLPLYLYCVLKKIQDKDFKIKLVPLLLYVVVLLIFTVVRNFTVLF